MASMITFTGNNLRLNVYLRKNTTSSPRKHSSLSRKYLVTFPYSLPPCVVTTRSMVKRFIPDIIFIITMLEYIHTGLNTRVQVVSNEAVGGFEYPREIYLLTQNEALRERQLRCSNEFFLNNLSNSLYWIHGYMQSNIT